MTFSGNANEKTKNKLKDECINELTKEIKYKNPGENKEMFEFMDELLNKITNFKKAIDGKTQEARFTSQEIQLVLVMCRISPSGHK